MGDVSVAEMGSMCWRYGGIFRLQKYGGYMQQWGYVNTGYVSLTEYTFIGCGIIIHTYSWFLYADWRGCLLDSHMTTKRHNDNHMTLRKLIISATDT